MCGQIQFNLPSRQYCFKDGSVEVCRFDDAVTAAYDWDGDISEDEALGELRE